MSKSLGYFFRRFQSPSRHFYFFISSTFPIFSTFLFFLLCLFPFLFWLALFACTFRMTCFRYSFAVFLFINSFTTISFSPPSQLIFILKLPFPRSGDNKESSRERKEGGKEGRKEGGRESRPKTKTFGTRNGRLERFLPPSRCTTRLNDGVLCTTKATGKWGPWVVRGPSFVIPRVSFTSNYALKYRSTGTLSAKPCGTSHFAVYRREVIFWRITSNRCIRAFDLRSPTDALIHIWIPFWIWKCVFDKLLFLRANKYLNRVSYK